MKRNLLLLFSTMLITFQLFAQNQSLELTFTGIEKGSSNHITLDSILVRNISKELDTILIGFDTTIMMNVVQSVNEKIQQEIPFKLHQNYPNPYRDQTTFTVSVFHHEEITISLYDIYGQKLSEIKKRNFSAGTHLFTVKGNQSKFYIITVSGAKYSTSIKLVNSNPTGGSGHSLSYSGVQPIEVYYKVSQSLDGFPYSMGDELVFVGYSAGYEINAIKDSPMESYDYIFEFNKVDTFVCGDLFIDDRDGQEYQTIEIDRQCWMTQNMNIGEVVSGEVNQEDNDIIEKYCYDNEEVNCDQYGGLYQWDELLQYDTAWSNQGICPEGWHIPTEQDWNSLIDRFGGFELAGDSLISDGASGFEALMAGQNGTTGYQGQGEFAHFWTSKYKDSDEAFFYSIDNSLPGITYQSENKSNGRSVRCIKGLPTKINPNVVILDSNQMILVSDSIELSNGVYRFEYSSSQVIEGIEVGSVIFSSAGNGFIRKVNEVVNNSPYLILQTTHGTIEDLFEQVEIEYTYNKGTDSKEEGWKFLETNFEIFAGSGTLILAEEVDFELDPDFTFELKMKNFTLQKFIMTCKGELNFMTKYKVESTSGLTIDVSEVLVPILPPIKVLVPIGPITLPSEIISNVKTKLNIEIEESMSKKTGFSYHNSFYIGTTYINGKWSKIWEIDDVMEVFPVEVSSEKSLSVKVSFGPSLEWKFLKFVGPYYFFGAYGAFNMQYQQIPFYAKDFEFVGGIGINLGVEAEVFGFTLVDQSLNLLGYEWQLWNSPDTLFAISDTIVTGVQNEPLSDPIKVQVLDSEGYPSVHMPVHMEITQGDGSLLLDSYLTDEDGYVETYWTMGSSSGVNKMVAKVFKGDGTHIPGSPREFVATVANYTPCPGIPTVTYGDQVYNTVQIGNQCWLRENMNYETGNSWCYDNDDENCAVYGRLYDWNTAMTVCPEGWHLPSSGEWTFLANAVGGEDAAGGELKEAGTDHWLAPNMGATDNYGFKALPGGSVYQGATFGSLFENAYFWTSTPWTGQPGRAWYSHMNYNSGSLNILKYGYKEDDGYSVRCIKD